MKVKINDAQTLEGHTIFPIRRCSTHSRAWCCHFVRFMAGGSGKVRKVKDRGTFGYLDTTITGPELHSFMPG